MDRNFASFAGWLLAGAMAWVVSSVAVVAGEIDLTAAGCPPFPEPAKRVGLWIVLHEDGTAEDCRIETGGTTNCADAYDARPGFLCISFNGDKHPRSVNTSAEGPLGGPVDRLVVDGVVAEPVYGYAHSRFIGEFGSGPSGDTYDVVAETVVGGTSFVIRLEVTNVGTNTIRINTLNVNYAN